MPRPRVLGRQSKPSTSQWVSLIAEPLDTGPDPWVVGPIPERAAEPWSRVHPGDGDDGALGCANVGRQPDVGEQWHPRMVEGVVPDQMTALGDRACQPGVGLCPSALEEEGRRHALGIEGVEHALRGSYSVRPIRMLRIEGQGDPERHCRRAGGSPRRRAAQEADVTCRRR